MGRIHAPKCAYKNRVVMRYDRLMEIITKKLKDLKPYNNNPRQNDEAVEYVARSIAEFGFKVPIVIDKDNVIVCGHTRYKASQNLGLKEVPCIVADDLNPEQIKAFRLADNKVAELSEWDYEALDMELESIFDIDMENFGFEFEDKWLEHEKNAETTQERVERILNLDKASYKGDGKYDIPSLEPVTEIPEITEWKGFNYVLSDDSEDKSHTGIHFFIDDYQFERLWNNPEAYVEKLKEYGCVATPDFSPYADMPHVCQLFNHYRKHWIGAFLQQNGVTVIPTIRASRDERSLEWYLDGEPKGGIVIISSMWTAKDDDRDYFLREYNGMYETLTPKKIFVYGNEVEGLQGNIEYVKSFTRGRFDG